MAPDAGPVLAGSVEQHRAGVLSPDGAAARLNVGRTTIFKLIASGELPSVRIGKLRRIPARALMGYVERLVAGNAKSLEHKSA